MVSGGDCEAAGGREFSDGISDGLAASDDELTPVCATNNDARIDKHTDLRTNVRRATSVLVRVVHV